MLARASFAEIFELKIDHGGSMSSQMICECEDV